MEDVADTSKPAIGLPVGIGIILTPSRADGASDRRTLGAPRLLDVYDSSETSPRGASRLGNGSLSADGIETPPCVLSGSHLPPYQNRPFHLPVAEDLSRRGVMLPTHALLSEEMSAS